MAKILHFLLVSSFSIQAQAIINTEAILKRQPVNDVLNHQLGQNWIAFNNHGTSKLNEKDVLLIEKSFTSNYINELDNLWNVSKIKYINKIKELKKVNRESFFRIPKFNSNIC